MRHQIENLPKNPNRIYTIRYARDRYYILLEKQRTFSMDDRPYEILTLEDLPKDFDYDSAGLHWDWKYEIYSEYPTNRYSLIGGDIISGQYDTPPKATDCFLDFLQRMQQALVAFAEEREIPKEECDLYRTK